MNKNRVIAFVAGAILGKAVVEFVIFHRDEERKRREIRANVKAEIEAILTSKETVLEKIRNGDYRGKGLKDVYTDLEFYQIAHHEKD